MTVDLFLESLLLGNVYKNWYVTEDGVNQYYTRRLTDEEYFYLVNDLSAVFPINTTINTLSVDVVSSASDNSAFISVLL